MTENEMTDLLLKLADLGVTGIKIFYSGSGDSGDIEKVMAILLLHKQRSNKMSNIHRTR